MMLLFTGWVLLVASVVVYVAVTTREVERITPDVADLPAVERMWQATPNELQDAYDRGYASGLADAEEAQRLKHVQRGLKASATRKAREEAAQLTPTEIRDGFGEDEG